MLIPLQNAIDGVCKKTIGKGLQKSLVPRAKQTKVSLLILS